jgi:hypothetical protein
MHHVLVCIAATLAQEGWRLRSRKCHVAHLSTVETITGYDAEGTAEEALSMTDNDETI